MIRTGALLFAAAFCVAAQTKVGIINSQQAVVQTAEIRKAQAELEVKYKPRQAEMEKLQKEIADLETQLRQGQGKLTAQAEQSIQLQGQRRQRDLQRIQEDLQAEVNREREEILTRTSGRMQQVVGKLAETRGLDVVIDVSNTIYFKPALDITKEAVVAYDQSFPVGGTAPAAATPPAAAPAK